MSYTFRWAHPAEDVHVTGTFDNWTKSVELNKVGTGFEKLVTLPPTTEKILYKFVVDGTWIHDHTGKTETDHEGNVNNVLYPADLGPALPMECTTSSVAPGATTTDLAGEVPLEKQTSLPGAFPETPAADLSANDSQKDGLANAGASTGPTAGETLSNAGTAAAAGIGSAFAAGAAALGIGHATSSNKDKEAEESVMSVNPIPASQGTGNPITLAPGEKVPEASTIHSNTIASTVRDDPELVKNTERAFGVAPIPATGGTGNPITLAPGEKVPEASTISASTLNSYVKLDKESYEKSDSGAPVLRPVVTAQNERDAIGAALFSGLGPQTTNMIPESSMGMGGDVPPSFDGAGATISSVGANSTTNELAGKQPIIPRGVPAVVAESQHAAHVDPEAAANPEAVQEKNEMESELKSKVPEEEATGDVKGVDGVPSVVTDSQHKAHVEPDAAANPEAVQEKNEMENELKSKVPEEEAGTKSSNGGLSSGGIAAAVTGGLATVGAVAAGAALTLNQKAKETTGTDAVGALPQSVQNSIHDANQSSNAGTTVKSSVPAKTASAVPFEVKQSQQEAHVAPEASANSEAVTEKSEVEKELLAKVPTAQESGQPAPTTTAGTSTTAPVAVAAARTAMSSSSGAPQSAEPVSAARPATSSSGAPQLVDPVGAGLAPISMDEKSGLNAPAASPAQISGAQQSRDVSPMTKPTTTGQTAPVVTSGVTSSEVPSVQSSAPVGTPRKHQASTSTSTPTSNKRNSIIDRLKGSPAESSKAGSEKSKKKGLFSRIKEKLKN